MRVAAINGSPKPKDSTSAQIIKQIEGLLGEPVETYHAAKLIQSETPIETIKDILSSDVLLIVFPLYVDSLPAPLIELLTRLEMASRDNATTPWVFAVTNSGFFEAEQNTLALSMIEHFSSHTGLRWGYGIGIGGGGMLAGMGEDWSKGPVYGIYNALSDMAVAMRDKVSRQNVFVTPNIPRFVYKFAADFGMRRTAKRNGVKNIRARPYMEQ